MKKFFMIFAAMLTFTAAAFAGTPVETSKVFDNTYVSVNVGASGDITPSNWGYEGKSFWESVRPTATLRFGKWVTPTFGVELQGECGFGTLNVPTFVDHTYVGANAMVNLNNLLCGYRGKADKVEFVPYAGIGWWHSYGVVTNNIATQYGVKVNVNLGKSQAWQLNVVPQITYLLAGNAACQNVYQPHFDVQKSYVGLQVGVTYKFKNQYGTHDFVLCNKKYTQLEMDEMNAEINRLRQANSDMASALKDCEARKNKVERVVVVEVKDRAVHYLPKVHFNIGSSELTADSEASLSEIAQVIKTSGEQWSILGYASEEGSAEFNEILSLERAKVVAEKLLEMGVNSEQLVVKGCGETTKFSTEYPQLNRVVEIVE